MLTVVIDRPTFAAFKRYIDDNYPYYVLSNFCLSGFFFRPEFVLHRTVSIWLVISEFVTWSCHFSLFGQGCGLQWSVISSETL